MELIKPIIRVGNSAGVILPREWLNGEAKITLLRKPQNIKQEILDILEKDLSSIMGLYLVGSYARTEQTNKSDIDVLGITTHIDKKIKKGKYEIVLISYKNLKEDIGKNILPLLPMLKEAIPIFNGELIKEYENYPLNKNNLKWHIETTLSALKLVKEAIDFAKEDNENISDNIVYSLILRLREVYIVECLIDKKIANNTELIKLIKNLSGSINIYEAYQRSKSNLKSKRLVSVQEAESIYDYVVSSIAEQKEWIKRNG